MELGRIVHSNSHVDYVCQIAQRSETAAAPTPADYAFGTVVGMAGIAGTLVGVIYDTRRLNPEFGNLGPRAAQGRQVTARYRSSMDIGPHDRIHFGDIGADHQNIFGLTDFSHRTKCAGKSGAVLKNV